MPPVESRLEIENLARRGVELGREERWNEALPLLTRAFELKDRGHDLGGEFYSFLGYAIAKCQNRGKEGLQLCEHAVKIEFYNTDNYLNLARVQFLTGNRRQGVDALERGLKLDRANEKLIALQREMGIRRRPVFGFLSRDNLFNQILGRLRHGFAGPAKLPPKR